MLLKVSRHRNTFIALYSRSVGLAHHNFCCDLQQYCAACARTRIVNSKLQDGSRSHSSGCASYLGLPGPRLDTGFGLRPNSDKLANGVKQSINILMSWEATGTQQTESSVQWIHTAKTCFLHAKHSLRKPPHAFGSHKIIKSAIVPIGPNAVT